MIVAAAPTDLDSLRVRNEFLEMPGLAITVPQVARILGVRSAHAAEILETLVAESFLTHEPNASYHRSLVIQRHFRRTPPESATVPAYLLDESETRRPVPGQGCRRTI